jgi:hypothetical protein
MGEILDKGTERQGRHEAQRDRRKQLTYWIKSHRYSRYRRIIQFSQVLGNSYF